ncbi:hypothetical protein JXM67_12540 [candidate division WOR-3 bacterium]|nr:hypothetical protein [candidate division WOR-3 bacterium]
MLAVGDLHPALYETLEDGIWHQGNFPDSYKLTKGMTQDYFGTLKAFMLDEFKDILINLDMNVLECRGFGSLAHLCGVKTVDMIRETDEPFDKFLDLCERFDAKILPNGPGTRGRAGLIAVAEPQE